MSNVPELIKKALELKKAKKSVEQHNDIQRQKEYDNVIIRITNEFEAGFVDVLPMLKEAGITYKGGTQHRNYPSNATYIEFFYGKKSLKMDFVHRKSYRYEFVYKSSPSDYRNHCTMTYGDWDKDRFIMWIYDELINKDKKLKL